MIRLRARLALLLALLLTGVVAVACDDGGDGDGDGDVDGDSDGDVDGDVDGDSDGDVDGDVDGDSDGDGDSDCSGFDEETCLNANGCGAIRGRELIAAAAGEEWSYCTGPAEFIVCQAITGCGDAESYACDSDGTVYLFSNTCTPPGWTSCEPDGGVGPPCE